MKTEFKTDAAGWIEVARVGEWPTAMAGGKRVVQVVTLEVLSALAKSPLPCLVDADHESEDGGKRTEALGWIEEWKATGYRLLGRVRWTALGEPVVKGGIYRFTSPVWLYEEMQKAEGRRQNEDASVRVRPTQMVSVGLTNRPNIPGMAAISNSIQNANKNKFPAAAKAASRQQNQTPAQPEKKGVQMDYKDELLKLLGLGADATDEQIVAACTDHAAGVQELEDKCKQADEAATNRELDAAGVSDAEERKVWQGVIASNREGGLKLLANRKAEADKVKAVAVPLTNRFPAKTPVAPKNEAAENASTAAKIANRAVEIEKTQRIPFARAHALAAREIMGEPKN